MNKKKTATMVASLALVGAIGVGATLAYLSDKSNSLRNTFTIGEGYNPVGPNDQAVWIDETDINKESDDYDFVFKGENRTLDGNIYNDVYAESKLKKDPVLRLANDSVKSYGYIRVLGITDDHNITINTEKWEAVETYDQFGNGIYRYKEVMDPGETEAVDGEYVYDENKVYSTESLFKATDGYEIVIDSNFDKEELGAIDLVGCAVQAVTTENGVEVAVPVDEANSIAKAEMQKK